MTRANAFVPLSCLVMPLATLAASGQSRERVVRNIHCGDRSGGEFRRVVKGCLGRASGNGRFCSASPADDGGRTIEFAHNAPVPRHRVQARRLGAARPDDRHGVRGVHDHGGQRRRPPRRGAGRWADHRSGRGQAGEPCRQQQLARQSYLLVRPAFGPFIAVKCLLNRGASLIRHPLAPDVRVVIQPPDRGIGVAGVVVNPPNRHGCVVVGA